MILDNGFGAVRVQMRQGEPIFRGKDVCDVLGLSNHNKSLGDLESYQRVEGVTISDPLGGKQKATFINEAGLYALIFKSRKPEAKAFQKWVTCEVLPSIRKYGTYSTDSRVMEKAKERANEKASAELRSYLKKVLSTGDKAIVARRCRVGVGHVNDVLRGWCKDGLVLERLIEQVKASQKRQEAHYTVEGVRELMHTLKR